MDRSIMFKYIFLLIIAIFIVSFSLYNFFGDDKNDEDIEDMFITDDETSSNFSIDDLSLDDLSLNEEDENVSTEKEDELTSEDEQHELVDEFNYKQRYIDQFGKQTVERAFSSTELAINLWLNKETDVKKWESHVTKSFLDKVKNIKKDNREKAKKINSLEIFATEQIKDDEMIIGCIAHYDNNTEFFNVIFTEEGDVFLIDNIVSMWSN